MVSLQDSSSTPKYSHFEHNLAIAQPLASCPDVLAFLAENFIENHLRGLCCTELVLLHVDAYFGERALGAANAVSELFLAHGEDGAAQDASKRRGSRLRARVVEVDNRLVAKSSTG